MSSTPATATARRCSASTRGRTSRGARFARVWSSAARSRTNTGAGNVSQSPVDGVTLVFPTRLDTIRTTRLALRAADSDTTLPAASAPRVTPAIRLPASCAPVSPVSHRLRRTSTVPPGSAKYAGSRCRAAVPGRPVPRVQLGHQVREAFRPVVRGPRAVRVELVGQVGDGGEREHAPRELRQRLRRAHATAWWGTAPPSRRITCGNDGMSARPGPWGVDEMPGLGRKHEGVLVGEGGAGAHRLWRGRRFSRGRRGRCLGNGRRCGRLRCRLRLGGLLFRVALLRLLRDEPGHVGWRRRNAARYPLVDCGPPTRRDPVTSETRADRAR
jgi:hypothetical protein